MLENRAVDAVVGLVRDVAVIELGVSVLHRVPRANAERVACCSICVCMWRVVCVCMWVGGCVWVGGWVGWWVCASACMSEGGWAGDHL